jgi:LmbE family N-acetylglucosaminyl deacetylase
LGTERASAFAGGIVTHSEMNLRPTEPTPFPSDSARTAEHVWRGVLAGLPGWQPRTRLVVVASHPDDETLGAGGLVNQATRMCLEVAIVLITDGAKARPETLSVGHTRLAEFARAISWLSAGRCDVIRLGLPDAEVIEHEQELAAALETWLDPDCTLVAPFEHDGHTGHEAAGRAARKSARATGATLLRYPIWAWHLMTPRELCGRALVRLQLDPLAHRTKVEAIACYRSRPEERARGPVLPGQALEYFRRPYEVFLS